MKMPILVLTIVLVASFASAFAQPRDPAPSDELDQFFKTKTKTLTPQEREEIERVIQQLETTNPDSRQEAREAIVRYGTMATPFLVREVASSNHDRARSALVALAMLRDAESIPFLEQDLARPRFMVSTFAALALGKFDTGVPAERRLQMQERLLEVVLAGSARDAYDRAASAIALARLGPGPDVAPLLALASKENDVKVLSAVVIALGRIGGEEVFREVIRHASSGSERVVQASILALGDLGDERAIPFLLTKIRSDESPKTLAFACGAISRFARPEVSKALLGFLARTDISKESRAVALRALGSQDPDPDIRRVLLLHARNLKEDPMIRSGAIASLFAYSDEEVSNVLQNLLADEDPAIRGSAAILLAHHKVEGAVPAIRKLLTSEEQAVAEPAALALVGLLGGEAQKILEAVPADSKAYPFVQNVLLGFVRPDWKQYFRGWLQLWIEGLGGQSPGLRRNLENEQLYPIFDLEGRLYIKGGRRSSVGEKERDRVRILSTAQQDFRLWIENEPYF